MGNNPSLGRKAGSGAGGGQNIRPLFEELIASVEETNQAVLGVSFQPNADVTPAGATSSSSAAADTAKAINAQRRRRRTMEEQTRPAPLNASSTEAAKEKKNSAPPLSTSMKEQLLTKQPSLDSKEPKLIPTVFRWAISSSHGAQKPKQVYIQTS